MRAYIQCCSLWGVCCLGTLPLQPAHAQHGVIREYAALAPKPDAVPLAPLFDAPLTDFSIMVGPNKAFYLTGSPGGRHGAVFTNRLSFWRQLAPHYPRAHDEGRTLLQSAFSGTADLQVTDTELRVTLAPLSSPHRSRAIAALCEELNKTNTTFPGLSLRLHYAVQPAAAAI